MANKTSKSNEGYFAKYKTSNKEASNRKRKLERQLKLQPSNEKQILAAIVNIHHRRHTPKAPFWSHTSKHIAQMMKHFTGKFDKLVFATDPKIADAAFRTRDPNKFPAHVLPVTTKGSMFGLQQRARITQWK